MPKTKNPLTRLALGVGLAVLALVLLVQGVVLLAVEEISDDYVRRFMRGTATMLVEELRPLDSAARLQRVKQLDELFVYPVQIILTDSLPKRLSATDRDRLARGELLVQGFNRLIYAGIAPGDPQILRLGPLNADNHPGNGWVLPRELWLQLAVALALAASVVPLSWWLMRPAWRDLRHLQEAGEAMLAGRFDEPIKESQSHLFAPIAAGGRAMLAKLASALASQRELTGSISHELRTPLARLRFALDALVDEEDAAQRELAVQACERDLDELDTLIDTSLMLARLDMGALEARCEMGDLAALLATEVQSLAPLLDGKKLQTNLTLPPLVRFDARLLPYGLRNALRNAARHARAEVLLSASVEQGQVLLMVDDDGEGVPVAEREDVFTPFKRLANKRSGHGFGLGLAIVRRVAEAHGGAARIETAPLGGARLLMSWPAQIQDA
ncbi:ATP-binding protein [Roseateles albus]|uniref:histidine kinase n=1 Tax=Roseateles albus TaxID=2987525 RepID=A0ABT5K8M5_9BURK|nr:ATP-binding protein [Roseateles albus]MDC8770285.1 ATP-binding protein [Roseateles albus]